MADEITDELGVPVKKKQGVDELGVPVKKKKEPSPPSSIPPSTADAEYLAPIPEGGIGPPLRKPSEKVAPPSALPSISPAASPYQMVVSDAPGSLVTTSVPRTKAILTPKQLREVTPEKKSSMQDALSASIFSKRNLYLDAPNATENRKELYRNLFNEYQQRGVEMFKTVTDVEEMGEGIASSLQQADIQSEKIKTDPNDFEAKVSLAEQFSNLGRKDLANKTLDAVIAANPNYVPAYAEKAHIAGNGGDYGSAITILDEGIRNNPAEPSLYLNRGIIKSAADANPQDAIKDLTTGIELTKNPYLLKNLYSERAKLWVKLAQDDPAGIRYLQNVAGQEMERAIDKEFFRERMQNDMEQAEKYARMSATPQYQWTYPGASESATPPSPGEKITSEVMAVTEKETPELVKNITSSQAKVIADITNPEPRFENYVVGTVSGAGGAIIGSAALIGEGAKKYATGYVRGATGILKLLEGKTEEGASDIVKGSIKGLAGLVHAGMGALMTFTPTGLAFSATTGAVSETLGGEELQQYLFAPITSITEPKTEVGQDIASIFDVGVVVGLLHVAKGKGVKGTDELIKKLENKEALNQAEIQTYVESVASLTEGDWKGLLETNGYKLKSKEQIGKELEEVTEPATTTELTTEKVSALKPILAEKRPDLKEMIDKTPTEELTKGMADRGYSMNAAGMEKYFDKVKIGEVKPEVKKEAKAVEKAEEIDLSADELSRLSPEQKDVYDVAKEMGDKEAIESIRQEIAKPKEIIEEAIPIKEPPSPAKPSYTSRDQKYTVKRTEDELQVVNRMGEEVGEQKRTEVIREYEDKYDYSKGKKAEDYAREEGAEFKDPKEAESYTAQKSENPLEIIEAYQRSHDFATEKDYKSQILEDYVTRIDPESYKRYGDPNNITQTIAKRFFKKGGRPIDELALEASEMAGREITPQDIVDFIETDKYQRKVPQITRDLQERFRQITGLTLTDRLAEKAIDVELTKLNKQYEKFFDTEATDYASAEQQYYDQIKRGEIPEPGAKEISAVERGEEGAERAGLIEEPKEKLLTNTPNESKDLPQKYETKGGEEIPFSSLREQKSIDFPSESDLPGKGGERAPYDSGLKPNEVCWMERRLSEQKHISLTGPEKIKSSADVAYLFRHLEDATTENVFAVLQKKDGTYNVVYLSTGGTTGTVVDIKLIYAAAKEFGADSITFVHNHPSGNLLPSPADFTIYNRMKDMLEASDMKLNPAVIINLDSGKYAEFTRVGAEEITRPTAVKKERAVKTFAFDKQILYTPSAERTKITSSQSIAEFLSQQKRGSVPKMGILILDRANRITRYILEENTLSTKELTSKIMENIGKSGETAILVSNSKFDVAMLKEIRATLRKGDMDLLDAIETTDNADITRNYESYAEAGKLQEPLERYGKGEQDKLIAASVKSVQRLIEKGIAETEAIDRSIVAIKKTTAYKELLKEEGFKAEAFEQSIRKGMEKEETSVSKLDAPDQGQPTVTTVPPDVIPPTIQPSLPVPPNEAGKWFQKWHKDVSKRTNKTMPIFTWLNKMLFDQHALSKTALEKAGAYGVIAMKNIAKGAGAYAKELVAKYEDSIYGKLDRQSTEFLNDIITARRTIELDAKKDKLKAEHTSLISELQQTGLTEKRVKEIKERIAEIEESGIERLKHTVIEIDGKKTPLTKELAEAQLENIKSSDPAMFEDLNKRADAYFEANREILKIRLDEGLITKETYDRLSELDYSKRLFVERMMDWDILEQSGDYSMGEIQRLKDGSEDLLFDNTRALFEQNAASTARTVFQNRANKSLYDWAKENPDNGFVRIDAPIGFSAKGEPKWSAPKTGEHAIYHKVADTNQRVIVDGDFYSSWVGTDPMITATAAQAIQWATGTKILKYFATGINAAFALKNLPRDIMTVLFTTDAYKLSPAISSIPITIDVVKNTLRYKKAFQDYVEHGGGFDTLTSQGGKIFTSAHYQSKISQAGKAIESAAQYINNWSEQVVKISVYERMISKRSTEFEKKNGRKPNAEETKYIKFLAANDARSYMDFSAKGKLSDAANNFFPYLNAGMQALRSFTRYAKNNPAKFAYRVGEFGAITSAAIMYNMSFDEQDEREGVLGRKAIQPHVQAGNLIVMLPWTKATREGQRVRPYIKIPISQDMTVFKSFFDAITEWGKTGEFKGEPIGSALKIITPVGDGLPTPPIYDAVLGYQANYDFFRNEAFWKGAEVKPTDEFTPQTPQMFIDLSKGLEIATGGAVGLSPERLKGAYGKVFTDHKSNIYSVLFSNSYDAITNPLRGKDKLEFDDIAAERFEQLYAPFMKSYYGTPSNRGKEQQLLKEKRMEENSRKLREEKSKVSEAVKNYKEATTKTERDRVVRDLITYGKELDKIVPGAYKRIENNFVTARKISNVKNHILVSVMYENNPEIQARVFYELWKDAPQDRRESLMADAELLKLGSKRFITEFNRLRVGG